MTSIVRYSTGASDVGPAKNFSWEYPIPQNRFWDDLSFVIGRNFLTCFSEDELVRLPLDPDSVQSRETKLELLLRLLEDRATEREAAAAAQHDKRNDGGEQRLTWYDVDYEGWSRQRLGVATLQEALGRFDDEEATVRELCLRRKDKTNLSYPHTLTVILLRKKQFAEAAENEAPVLEWLTGRLGADSPQARKHHLHSLDVPLMFVCSRFCRSWSEKNDCSGFMAVGTGRGSPGDVLRGRPAH